jgi:hypothetical protein
MTQLRRVISNCQIELSVCESYCPDVSLLLQSLSWQICTYQRFFGIRSWRLAKSKMWCSELRPLLSFDRQLMHWQDPAFQCRGQCKSVLAH